jgi:primosomal protein N'
MTEQAIASVKELPAELRAELVAKREAGTTLAELKKAYAHVAPDVIREVLPPLPKPTAETKPARSRKSTATKPAPTPTTRQRKGGTSAASRKLAAGQAKAAKQAAGKPRATTTNGTDDKARLELARKVVAARDKDGLSWLKIGARFKLSTSEQPKAGASRARTLYRLVKGDDADTGPLPAKV